MNGGSNPLGMTPDQLGLNAAINNSQAPTTGGTDPMVAFRRMLMTSGQLMNNKRGQSVLPAAMTASAADQSPLAQNPIARLGPPSSMPTFNGNSNTYAPNALQQFMQKASSVNLGVLNGSLTGDPNRLGPPTSLPPPPGTGTPGTGNPGTGNPGTGNPGTGNPLSRGPGLPNIPGAGTPGDGYVPGGGGDGGTNGNAPLSNQKARMIQTGSPGMGSSTPDVQNMIANAGPPPQGATGWSAGPYGPGGQWVAVPQWSQQAQGYLTSVMHPASGTPSWLTPDVQNQEFTNPNFLALIQQLSGKPMGSTGSGAGNFGY